MVPARVCALLCACLSGSVAAFADQPETAPRVDLRGNEGGSTALAPDRARDGLAYPVARVRLAFPFDHPAAPDLTALADTSVRLTPTPQGWIAPPTPDAPTVPIPLDHEVADAGDTPPVLFGSAVAAITRHLQSRLAADPGLIGHLVIPDPAQIDPATNEDLRPEQATDLTILIYLATVADTRTIGFGRRLPTDAQPINHPAHARILEHTPLAAGDLLARPPIDRFVARLNRHPGRRIETAVAPTGEPGQVSLDYLITEAKPWTAYAQVANTGTRSTDEIRMLFGARHTQLTGHDDVLTVNYITAEFDATNAVAASYARPLDDLGRLTLTIDGAWNEYTASDIGLGLQALEGEGYDAGAELAFELAHLGPSGAGFLHAFAGLRYRRISIDNLLAGVEGETDLLLATAGLRFSRSTLTSDTTLSGSVEVNLPTVAGTDEEDLVFLGRSDADASFAVFRFDAAHSFALEPIFDPGGYGGERGPGAMSLAHRLTVSARGQYTPERRLVANLQAIAGGFFTVRGYEEAIASGDSALIATVEYRYSIASALPPAERAGSFLGRPFRTARQEPYGAADWDIGLRAFADLAVIDNNDRAPGEADETLLGVGVGIDARLWTNLTARADLGIALSDARSQTNPANQGDTRLHFAVIVSY